MWLKASNLTFSIGTQSMADDIQKPLCFLSFSPATEITIRDVVIQSVQEAGFQPVWPGDIFGTIGEIDGTIIGGLARADYIVAELTGQDYNIYFELGSALTMGKGVF